LSTGRYDPDEWQLICQEAIDAVALTGSKAEASRRLNIPWGTLLNRVRKGEELGLAPTVKPESKEYTLPQFGEDDISAPEILDHLEKRFEKKYQAQKAQHWFKIKVNNDLPRGLAVVGDPHLGPNCNISLLRKDVEILSSTPGMMAVNIGDTADNWSTGRLIQLYSEEDISRPTEQKLAHWYLRDSGIPWVLWLHGNHEMMHSEFATYLRSINVSQMPMLDWRARFKLVFPSTEIKIDAAHDHKGHSQFNPTHGQKKAALWDEDADIYVAGHRHLWALSHEELDDGRVVHFGRARGYKWIDKYAVRHQFYQQKYGATILFVIDPLAETPVSRIHSFVDLEEGAKFLAWKRENAES